MTTFGIILFSLIPIIALLNPYWRKRTNIKHWYNALAIDKHLATYQILFQNINGFALSRESRTHADAIEYTYGEIDFISFIALLSLVKPNSSTVFYDLGSGVGKAVFACALVFKVKKSCGVELFNLLHQAALQQRNSLTKLPDYQAQTNALYFINSNFLDVNFSDATVIFMNATAFFGDTWTAIQQCLNQLKPGAYVITTSKKISLSTFKLIKTTAVQMSWGPVSAYIQQRV